jgi:hypothetical protein
MSMRTHTILALVLLCVLGLTVPAAAQAPSPTQDFPLTDTQRLVAKGATMEAGEFLGRRAVRLTKPNPDSEETLALLAGTDFQDGTIEADVAVKILTPPGVRMPGFIGIGFRSTPDASSFDLFYIRPGNARAEDQSMRNHAVQYCAPPHYSWYDLRRAWPWVYEGHADIEVNAWTHIKIEVAGRVARLYLNNSAQPTIIVDGMKGENLRGGVLLSGYPSEEAWFSDLRITNATPQPVKNGSDAAGTWQVKLSTDSGVYEGALQLTRNGKELSGSWSGGLGQNLPVKGTWRDGYVELSFPGNWPKEAGNGTPGPAVATLAGWFDGDAGKGRSKVEARTDGVWTATRAH